MTEHRSTPRFGFTTNELRVLMTLAVVSLSLSAVAIVRPLLWPTAVVPALPILGEEESFVASSLPIVSSPDPMISAQPITAFVIDPNTAPADSLELLPGVGRVLADRIVEYRANHQFNTPLDLLSVKGIGPSVYESLREFIRINPHRMQPVKK